MEAPNSYEMNELRPPAGPRAQQQPTDSTATARGAQSSRKRWSPKQFWAENVDCVVDFEKCRDHLALERTFLAYLRTALMSAMFGTLVAQLFVLEQDDSGFGYVAVGRPLASLCYIFSISTVVLATCRAWRHQHAMINGRALTGGFEIMALAAISLAVIIVFFGFLIAIDVIKGLTAPV